MHSFSVNQIVRGKVAGTFLILGFRSDLDPSEVYAQLKTYDQGSRSVGAGELSLPVSALRPLVTLEDVQKVAAEAGWSLLDTLTQLQAAAARKDESATLESLCALKAEVLAGMGVL